MRRLKRKLAETRQPQISLSENSYDGKPIQELVDEEQKLRNFCRWAEEGALYDGHEFEDANGEFIRHEPETIRKHYSSAKEALEQSIPDARAKAEVKVGVQQDIARKWPELTSANGGKAKASYDAILAEPYFAALLKARPQAAYLAAHAVLGVKADQSKVRRSQAGNGSRNAAAPSLYNLGEKFSYGYSIRTHRGCETYRLGRSHIRYRERIHALHVYGLEEDQARPSNSLLASQAVSDCRPPWSFGRPRRHRIQFKPGRGTRWSGSKALV